MIKVSYKSKIYKIDKAKLLYVIEALEDRRVDNFDYDIALKYLDKYNLYDEIFLKGVSVD